MTLRHARSDSDAVISAAVALIAALPAVTTSTNALDLAAKALEELRVDEAIELLEHARSKQRFRYLEHVRLYEQLGTAYAYQGRAEETIAAFRMMLAIDPQHALRYTLSPKVTLLFEEARRAAAETAAAQIEVIWPRDLEVSMAIPVDVEVVSDPFGFLHTARVYVRRAGEPRYDAPRELALAGGRAGTRVMLESPDPEARAPIDLEIYAIVLDRRGNEVLRWASAERPRAIHLAYRPPPEWYEEWWAWTIAAAALAVGTSVAVYAATRSPSTEVPVTAGVER